MQQSLVRFVPCLLFFLLSASGITQSKSVFPAYKTKQQPPQTTQDVLLLFSGNTAEERILLTLNNNRSSALTTKITVYDFRGIPTPLPDISMIAGESKLIELSPILQASGIDRTVLGWVKLSYEGVILEMGAQLTLYPNGGSGVDAPRSLSSDFKTLGRESVFWMPPSSKVKISLTNSSIESLQVSLVCGHRKKEWQIAAGITDIAELLSSDFDDTSDSEGAAGSCSVDSTGSVTAIRASGVVVGPTGYAAPVRFYDPATARTPSIISVGLDTLGHTHVTIKNLSGNTVEFTPLLRESAFTSPKVFYLKKQILLPKESRQLIVDSEMKTARASELNRVNLILETNAPQGSLIGSVTQISPELIVQDIPFRTTNPPAFTRGSYPLRWDEDYTNLPMVANTTSKPLGIRAWVTAGTMTYVFPKETINPGATRVYDVDSAKLDGIADVNGHKLPVDAKYGKFHWAEMSDGKNDGLLGRTELASIANKRKSSFSCGSTCAYNFDSFPYLDPTMFNSLYSGLVQTGGLTEYYSPINGGDVIYPAPYHYLSSSLSITDPSISSVAQSASADTSYDQSANSVGSTDMNYGFFENTETYDPAFEICNSAQTETLVYGTATVTTATVQLVDTNCTPPDSNGFVYINATWSEKPVLGMCVPSATYGGFTGGSCVQGPPGGFVTYKNCYQTVVGSCVTTTCPSSQREVDKIRQGCMPLDFIPPSTITKVNCQ